MGGISVDPGNVRSGKLGSGALIADDSRSNPVQVNLVEGDVVSANGFGQASARLGDGVVPTNSPDSVGRTEHGLVPYCYLPLPAAGVTPGRLRARRKPRLIARNVGSRELRYADRQIGATSRQPPPRYTRDEPSLAPSG